MVDLSKILDCDVGDRVEIFHRTDQNLKYNLVDSVYVDVGTITYIDIDKIFIEFDGLNYPELRRICLDDLHAYKILIASNFYFDKVEKEWYFDRMAKNCCSSCNGSCHTRMSGNLEYKQSEIKRPSDIFSLGDKVKVSNKFGIVVEKRWKECLIDFGDEKILFDIKFIEKI